MPSVSFRLRRSDDNGSIVRQLGAEDNALRSDGYTQPFRDSGISSFNVYVLDALFETILDPERTGGSYQAYKSTVNLDWTIERPLVASPTTTTEPTNIVIVVSTEGEPVTVEDGTTIFSCDSETYAEQYSHESYLYSEATWLYYGMFIRYSDGITAWYERVADTYVQLPTLYNSVDNLWQRIPNYYRTLDASQANNDLYNYLSLFGWELDKTRTLLDSLMHVNDPMLATPVALDGLAKQLGLEIGLVDVGTKRLRAVLDNIFELRKRKGTVSGILSYISAISGCKSAYDPITATFKVYTQRVNLLSDPLFRELTLTEFKGAPATINRNPFTLRGASDGSSLRNTLRTDLAIRGSTTNTSGYLLYDYTTTQSASAAASVGWGVYTYGGVMPSGASVPTIEHVQYFGNNLNGASVPVVVSDGNGIKITIPADSAGPQNVVVYGRKPFKYADNVVYYTSFNCVLSGASFNNLRFIPYDNVTNAIESSPPDALGEDLFYDQWNYLRAVDANHFLNTEDTYYNNDTNIGNSTFGRFALEHPLVDNYTFSDEYVVPALTFTVAPGSSVVVSSWLVEPESIGKYFDGNEEFGGFIRQANQVSSVGLSDYRWGDSGGSPNQDFSHYTLDYGRVVATVERVLENNLIPVTMLGNYSIEWNKIPGE